MKKILVVTALAALLTACTVPQWVQIASQDAAVAAPIAASIVAIVSPAVAPLATTIASGFQALNAALVKYQSSPTATNLQAAQAAFQAVDSQVAQLETAAQVKDPATAAKITAIVNLLTQAIVAIQAQIPAAQQAALIGGPMHVHAVNKGLTPEQFKKSFNKIAKGDKRLEGYKFHIGLLHRL